jgi:PAS domain S-box-containing protein
MPPTASRAEDRGGGRRSAGLLVAASILLPAAPALLVAILQPRLYFVIGTPAYLVFHNLSEFFSVMVALSIFGVGWFTHEQSRDRQTLLLGCAFLAIGLVDFMHALSYEGMPDFFTPSSANKASQLWVAARLLTALALLGASAVRPESSSPWLSKAALLSASLALAAASFLLVVCCPAVMPAAYVPGQGQTLFKKVAELLIAGLMGVGLALHGRRYAATGDRLAACCAAALGVAGVGELLFAVYSRVTDTYNAMGHLYKIAAFALVYRGAFVASVQRPYLGLRREIAERRAAEEELERTSLEIHDLYDKAPCGYHSLDGSGAVTRINETELGWLGCSREEVLGRPFPDFLGPESRGVFQETFPRFKERGWVRDLEMELLRKDGTRIPVLVSSAAVRDPQGRYLSSRSTVFDITERRRLEAQFFQVQKLEAVGRLASGVAHDFNNLLTAILSFGDLLMEKLSPSDPLREEARGIREAGRRAATLTRQLLTFGRRQAFHPVTLDLNEVVAGMDRLLRRVIGEDLELITVQAPGLGSVRADPGLVEQVLMNLVVNARDAMPHGGRITVETFDAVLGEDRASRRIGVDAGDYVALSVSDTGCGMSAEVLSHIFEPFFTTKEKGKGSGLGLSTVYGIVRQAGGDLQVESHPGKGSTFRVYLPRTEGGAGAKARPPDASRRARGSETVLLAEDDPLVRSLVAEVLRESGYRVLEAADGEEALRVASAAPEGIDILVTDLVMPHAGGDELAGQLRRAQPEVRVLFISGYSEREVSIPSLGEPGVALMRKPFTSDALTRGVRELLDRAS